MVPRWEVEILYRHDGGKYEAKTAYMEELTHLAVIVEEGPHWGTIARIEVRLYRDAGEYCDLTVEQAAKKGQWR